eukprot:1348824-Pleurochrysis_carterae.AAC.1
MNIWSGLEAGGTHPNIELRDIATVSISQCDDLGPGDAVKPRRQSVVSGGTPQLDVGLGDPDSQILPPS